MGYFPNGTSGEIYESTYCSKCIHSEGCPVILAHLLHNYEECDNSNSILHILIPRDENGDNKKCLMFVASAKVYRGTLAPNLSQWARKNGIVEVKP